MAINDPRYVTKEVTSFAYTGKGGWDPDGEIIYKTPDGKSYPSSQIPPGAEVVHFKGGVFRKGGSTYINFPAGMRK